MRDKSLKSGERQHGPALNHMEKWHLWRYKEALKYIWDKRVLDMCCGVGYGSYVMAAAAKHVIGVDDSNEAIAFANKHYKLSNISYTAINFLDFYPGNKIDVVVSFEAIEHIEDTNKVFELFKKIAPGIFILSTPHLKCPIGNNKFHYRHYGMDEVIGRFWDIGYKPERAELVYFGNGLCNFYVGVQR